MGGNVSKEQARKLETRLLKDVAQGQTLWHTPAQAHGLRKALHAEYDRAVARGASKGEAFQAVRRAYIDKGRKNGGLSALAVAVATTMSVSTGTPASDNDHNGGRAGDSTQQQQLNRTQGGGGAALAEAAAEIARSPRRHHLAVFGVKTVSYTHLTLPTIYSV